MNKISQLDSQVKEDTAAKTQIDEDLKTHKADRTEANTAIANATKQREKENAIWVKESGDSGANIKALGKAVAAIEQGLAGGAFLQTTEGSLLKKIVETSPSISYTDRQSVTEFLSGAESAPGTSEIVGILKTLKDEMESDLKELNATEETAVTNFNGLIAARKKKHRRRITASSSRRITHSSRHPIMVPRIHGFILPSMAGFIPSSLHRSMHSSRHPCLAQCIHRVIPASLHALIASSLPRSMHSSRHPCLAQCIHRVISPLIFHYISSYHGSIDCPSSPGSSSPRDPREGPPRETPAEGPPRHDSYTA